MDFVLPHFFEVLSLLEKKFIWEKAQGFNKTHVDVCATIAYPWPK